MELCSIGTVVKLKNGEHKLMIISRTPLTNNNGVIGYYDYGACLYPEGQADSTTSFFNKEDIEDIFFEGYIDEDEEKIRESFEEKLANVTYPRLSVEDES